MVNMKYSGIDWIGDIPKEWSIAKIKYNCSLKGRIGWQGLTAEEYRDKGPFLITGTDFCNGKINWDTCVHVSDWRYEQAAEIMIKEGDLLITKDGTIGKVAIVKDMKDKTTLNSGVLLIREKKDSYSTKFLYYVLNSEEFWKWFNYINIGNTTISHLYQYDFDNFVFAITDKVEQVAIAKYLDVKVDKIDTVIKKVKEQIEILEKAKKSVITECVTKGLNSSAIMKDSGNELIGNIPSNWKVTRIKYVIDGIKDGTHGTFERVNEGKMLLSAKNVFNKGIKIDDDESLISESDYNEIVSNGYPKKGDVLLCCVGTIGRSCIYEFEYPLAFQRSIIFMRVNKDLILSKFLNYSLQSDSTLIQEQMLINKTAQEGLYMGSAKKIKIVLPPTIEEQQVIVDYLDKKCNVIDVIIEKKQQELETLEIYKKSLINEYVTGKKRVTM